jgi:hypothetical protein
MTSFFATAFGAQDDEVAIHVRKNAVLLNLADWFKVQHQHAS